MTHLTASHRVPCDPLPAHLPRAPPTPTPLWQEYELPADSGLSRAEQLRRQRGNLKQRLGLGGPLMDGVMDTDDMFGDDDLLASEDRAGGQAESAGGSTARGGRGSGGTAATAGQAKPPAREHKDASQLLADMSGMSARERAAAARRAKSLKRTASSAAGSAGGGKRAKGSAASGASGKGGTEAPSGSEAGGAAANDLDGSAAEAAEAEWAAVLQGGRWPFQSLCDQLCMDALHPCWEVRHGAALALREVLRRQAGAAGVAAAPAANPGGWAAAGGDGKLALGPVSAADAAAAAAANAGWLEDCAIHLLCVLALDRFGDFVSDQVGGGAGSCASALHLPCGAGGRGQGP